ncbi:MAG: DUF3089 domain-containing protein [Chitinophagales bacterium]
MRYGILIFILLLSFIPCFALDYSNPDNWAALPAMKDNADWTPKGLRDNQDSARADVFFIHPTTDLTGFKGNANIENNAINNQTDNFPIKYQASVFNGSCKVYAPRYRQAALNNFFARNSERSRDAFDFAYQDIREAFQYYLKYYNQGRPIIIAGHSQGSMHAQRLLREFFDGTPLQKQLVEAYIIGYPTKENQFQFLKVSEKADTFGGYISYCTFGMDAKIDWMTEYNNAVVVNPLSWTRDKTFVSASYNLGSVSRKSEEMYANVCGARCGNGVLEIQKPESGGFVSLGFKNYHLFDYNLFYLNIRENVAMRLKKFLEANHSTAEQ